MGTRILTCHCLARVCRHTAWRIVQEYQTQQRTVLEEFRHSENVLRQAVQDGCYPDELNEILEITQHKTDSANLAIPTLPDEDKTMHCEQTARVTGIGRTLGTSKLIQVGELVGVFVPALAVIMFARPLIGENPLALQGVTCVVNLLMLVLISSITFGLIHWDWGIAGMVQTGCMGLALGVSYLRVRRNLWVTILAHGYLDTMLLLPLYFAG